MNVGDDTTTCNGGLDQGVELLVASDGELQMSRCDSLHLEVLAGVSCKLENLGCQVFENGCSVHG